MKGNEVHSYVPLPEETVIPDGVVRLTGMTAETVAGAPSLKTVLHEFLDFAGDAVLIAHHALHEIRFLRMALWRIRRSDFTYRVIDTASVAKVVGCGKNVLTFEELAERYQVPLEQRHHALGDAKTTGKLWSLLMEEAKIRGMRTLGDLMAEISRL